MNIWQITNILYITREIDALHCSQPKHELQKHQQQIHQIPNTKWDLGICLLPNSNKECSMQMTLKRRNGPDQKIRYHPSTQTCVMQKWRFWIQQYSTVQYIIHEYCTLSAVWPFLVSVFAVGVSAICAWADYNVVHLFLLYYVILIYMSLIMNNRAPSSVTLFRIYFRAYKWGT